LALRSWRKSPAFAATALTSIALGIGVTAAVFTLVDHVLLRVLPVREPGELVLVTFSGSRYGNNWGDGSELSYPMYTEFRNHTDVLPPCSRGFRSRCTSAMAAAPSA
jgi:putative ABC transport system permease protein